MFLTNRHKQGMATVWLSAAWDTTRSKARGFNANNRCWINYRVRSFRAKAQSALLTLSDWAAEKDPGGPIGQEIIFSGMKVEPYLED